MKARDKKILGFIQEQELIIKKRTLHKNGDITIKYGKPAEYKNPQEQHAPAWFKEYEKKNDMRWLRQHNHNVKTREEIEILKPEDEEKAPE